MTWRQDYVIFHVLQGTNSDSPLLLLYMQWGRMVWIGLRYFEDMLHRISAAIPLPGQSIWSMAQDHIIWEPEWSVYGWLVVERKAHFWMCLDDCLSSRPVRLFCVWPKEPFIYWVCIQWLSSHCSRCWSHWCCVFGDRLLIETNVLRSWGLAFLSSTNSKMFSLMD